jgi:2-polyprenyl-6-methoxyphenol hydroxylase-like FAD-dependent oxidoreductase
MPNDASDTDLLIVGAGPVGLFLANECARRNLRWRIIDDSFMLADIESNEVLPADELQLCPSEFGRLPFFR